jgi:hypothetical protein
MQVAGGSSISFPVASLSTDPDPAPENIVPSLTAIVSPLPAHGTTTVSPAGVITYTANTGYAGPDLITYTVSDGGTPSLSGTGTICVTVLNVPVISIVATTPTASQVGPVDGVFSVSLTVAPTAATTVTYAIGGSAANGVDYSTIASTVSFSIGQTVATIPIVPGPPVGTVTVVLTLYVSF